jgi:hypothetical protein
MKNTILLKKLFDFILGLFSLILLYFTIQNLVADVTQFANGNILRSFVVFPLLTLAYVPFLYFVALLFAYETSFVYLNVILKPNRRFSRYLKWKIISLCHFNLRRLQRLKLTLSRGIRMQRDAEDMRRLLLEYEVEVENDWRFVRRWSIRIAIGIIAAFVLSMPK